MSSQIEILTEKLCDAIYDDLPKLRENILDAVHGCDLKLIREAFCRVTNGEFVEHEALPNCLILNQFPNIVIRDLAKKGMIIEYPFLENKRYYIRLDQKRPCHKISYAIGTNTKDLNVNGLQFKDGNEMNYEFVNLTLTKPKDSKKDTKKDTKNKKTMTIGVDEEGNEIVVNEKERIAEIGLIDVQDITIDVKSKFNITTIVDRGVYQLFTSDGWLHAIRDFIQFFASVHATT